MEVTMIPKVWFQELRISPYFGTKDTIKETFCISWGFYFYIVYFKLEIFSSFIEV
jgi:hypothetical protein